MWRAFRGPRRQGERHGAAEGFEVADVVAFGAFGAQAAQVLRLIVADNNRLERINRDDQHALSHGD